MESNLILQALNTTTKFSSRSSNFYNFTSRIHKKRSQKVRNPKFSWGGGCPQTPSRHATCALIAYWNPPFQNSKSAIDKWLSPHPTACYGLDMGILGNMKTYLWLVWSPWRHCYSHCSWLPQYWQCVSHCRVQWLEHLFHWWWLDWALDWQWWCSWLEPHHHIVGAATALWGSHCPDHTVEQWRRESGEERGDLLG